MATTEAIAEKAGEVTEEVVEEVLDGAVEVVEIVRNNPKTLVAAGVLGAALGAVGGYFFAKKQLTSYYEDLASEEIAEAKEFYASVNRVTLDGKPLTPGDVLDERHPEAAAALRSYQGGSDDEPEMTGEPHDEIVDEEQIEKITRRTVKTEPVDTVEDLEEEAAAVNVFEDPTFDLAEEKKYRKPDVPYVITHDEYMENEGDLMTLSLTYFERDDTLVDEQSKPIENTDVVGEDNLVRFGHGSRDKNIVYVRNESLDTMFEITRSRGSYLEEVLGIPNDEPDSLKHSEQREARRAFRNGDG